MCEIAKCVMGNQNGLAIRSAQRRSHAVSESLKLLDDEGHYASMSRAHNPYGDGKANQRIVEILKKAQPAK